MNHDELLLTYIEVAVAFAGFAALVTAIRDRGSSEVNPHLWVRLRGMVELALLVAAFSAGALCMRAFGVPDETLWRICSGGLAAAWSVQFFSVIVRARQLHRAGYPFGSKAYRYFLYSIALLSTVSLAANTFGWWPSNSGAVYVSSVGLLLLVCGVWFIRLVAGILPAGSPPNGAA